MTTRDYGKVVEVKIVNTGSELVQTQSFNDTTLYVEDVSDFDDDGGRLYIEGDIYTYLSTDDDTDTIKLAGSGLTTAYADETEVRMYPLSNEKWALVALEEGSDAIMARVPDFLYNNLDDGVRDDDDMESVEVELRGSDWVITDVMGANNETATKFMQDDFLVTAPGNQSIPLSFVPVENSEHVYWHPKGKAGIYQRGALWVREENTQVISFPDPDGAVFAGDRFTVEYAYRHGNKLDRLPMEWRIPIIGQLQKWKADINAAPDSYFVGGDPLGYGIWNDNMDSSYLGTYTFEHPDVSYVGGAQGKLEKTRVPTEGVVVYGRVRYQLMRNEMRRPTMYVRRVGASSDQFQILNDEAGDGGWNAYVPNNVITTVEFPLTLGGGNSAFLAEIQPDYPTVYQLNGFASAQFLSKNAWTTPETRIYEACLIVREA